MSFLKKIDVLYIITLVFLLLASNSNFLAANNLYWVLAILFMLVTAITRKTIGKKEVNFIMIFSAVFLVFVTVRDLLINNLETLYLISDAGFLLKYVLLAFAFVVALKEKALKYIVLVTVHLTVISFFFYFLQVIGLGKEIHDIPRLLNLPPSAYQDEGASNFLVFGITLNRHDYTNAGFLWEPGSFGCFLAITLLLNFFLTKFTFDKKTTILIIGLLTTFSTTSYLALMVILFLVYRVRVAKINIWVPIVTVVVVLLFIFVPFLGEKISTSYDADTIDLARLKVLEKFYHKQHSQIPLGRFSSMYYLNDAFGAKMILGFSNKYDYMLNRKNDVNISNGIFDFMARFGLVSLIYLFYCYLQFCYNFVRKPEFLIYCGILLLVLSFGEPILILPIILLFLFYPFIKEAKPAEQPAGNTVRGLR